MTADGLLHIESLPCKASPGLTGRVDWNAEVPGRIVRSEVAAARIMFVLRYADGVGGPTPRFSISHTSMTSGLTASNPGDEGATWTAKRSGARQ